MLLRFRHTATISHHTIDGVVFTVLKSASEALFACAVLTTVPTSADTIANLPFLLAWAECNDFPDNLMSRNARAKAS